MFTLQKRMARQKCKICPLKFVTACHCFSLKFMGEMGWGTLSPPFIYLLCCKIATTIVTQLPLICFSVEIAAEIKNHATCDLHLKSVTIFSLSASQDWLKIDQKYYHQDHFILESDFFLVYCHSSTKLKKSTKFECFKFYSLPMLHEFTKQ